LIEQYDGVCEEFNIINKVFKIVTDSAANNIKAFRDEPEAVEEFLVLTKMMIKQRKRELFKEKESLEKVIQEERVKKLNEEISEFNFVTPVLNSLKAKSAQQLILEMENDEDDETEELEEEENSDLEKSIDSDLDNLNEEIAQCDLDLNINAEKMVYFVYCFLLILIFNLITFVGFSTLHCSYATKRNKECFQTERYLYCFSK
jgi:hypothetical protein